MKRYRLMLFALATFALAGSANLNASELHESLVPDAPAVIIDDAVLYGVSDSATLTADLVTGELMIQYADGSRFTSQLDISARPDDPLLRSQEPISIHLGADPVLMSGACASQAQALTLAVGLVQSACSGGDSDACHDARVALASAYHAYTECMRVFLEER
ncbi:MAG: hypothetical protein HND55_02450 [Pseudomonadota bacterium]|nr:MAG: hypothetical protein HND55_02450 [Pseudomonadota bacterium]